MEMTANRYLPEGFLISGAENREYISSLAGLERAMAKDKILEGMAVLCDSSLSLTVELCPGVRGIIPRGEVLYQPDEGEIKDIAVITRVGKAVCFKVTGIERNSSERNYSDRSVSDYPDGENVTTVLLSRRAAQKECAENFISGLRRGDVIQARITHMEHFGAFADIGCGIVSLLPIDCISVSRISHPRDRFRCGEKIYAVVRERDAESGRVFISHKELLGSWEENAALFSAGQTVAGIVRSVEEYGIFVELTPNLAGLAELKPDITVGQTAAVYIKNIIPERMKIKLVLIDSYKGEILPCKSGYYTDVAKTAHISGWRYSPPECKKVVETVFDEAVFS